MSLPAKKRDQLGVMFGQSVIDRVLLHYLKGFGNSKGTELKRLAYMAFIGNPGGCSLNTSPGSTEVLSTAAVQSPKAMKREYSKTSLAPHMPPEINNDSALPVVPAPTTSANGGMSEYVDLGHGKFEFRSTRTGPGKMDEFDTELIKF
jgi:hypothetical protein